MSDRPARWRRAAGDDRPAAEPTAGRSPVSSSRALVAAVVLFSVVAVWRFAPVLAEGTRRSVPTSIPAAGERPARAATVLEADLTFQAWLVARNARTLVTRPTALFDTAHCSPADNSLTFGIPMITLGVLAIPAVVVSGDPILTYNFALWAMIVIAAVAMYLLVAEWTGVAAAGMAAGLLYGFHVIRTGMIFHPSVWDTTWTVFAMLFGRRLFAHGRWRDAVGLAVACALQLAASFYPLLAAVVLAPCFVIWLLATYGLRAVKPSQLAFVVVFLVLAAAVVLGPYLGTRARGDTFARVFNVPAPLWAYAPGGHLFVGYAIVALAAVALARGRRGLAPALGGDPRWALVASSVVVMLVAASWTLDVQARSYFPDLPFTIPDLYGALAAVVPGLDSVRIIARLGAGVHLAFSILAGIGAATLINASGRWRAAVSVALVLVAGADVLGPQLPGMLISNRWEAIDIHPGAEAVQFFETLGERSGGAIFELPFDGSGAARVAIAPRRIHLSYYHRRRTSACFGSYVVPGRERMAEMAWPVPGRAEIGEIAGLGFTTIVLHDAGAMGPTYREALDRLCERPRPPIERVLSSDGLVAYDIISVNLHEQGEGT